MSTAELKSNLHLLIDKITDSSKLQAIYTLLNESDDSSTIHEWQKDLVRERIRSTNIEEYTSWDKLEGQIRLG